MAKVTVILEDHGEGLLVDIQSDPPMKENLELTIAQEYAISLLQGILENSKTAEYIDVPDSPDESSNTH